MSTERWLPVVGFEGLYEVSDLGRVRGLDRRIGHPRGGTRLWRGRVLKQTVMSNGRRIVRTVHSVVCEAFHGPCPPGHTVAHENGKPLDCCATNLSWKTVKDNHADKHRHGTWLQGMAHPAARLTEGAIKIIRKLRSQGQTHEAIGNIVGCSRRNVGRILAGQLWAHL